MEWKCFVDTRWICSEGRMNNPVCKNSSIQTSLNIMYRLETATFLSSVQTTQQNSRYMFVNLPEVMAWIFGRSINLTHQSSPLPQLASHTGLISIFRETASFTPFGQALNAVLISSLSPLSASTVPSLSWEPVNSVFKYCVRTLAAFSITVNHHKPSCSYLTFEVFAVQILSRSSLSFTFDPTVPSQLSSVWEYISPKMSTRSRMSSAQILQDSSPFKKRPKPWKSLQDCSQVCFINTWPHLPIQCSK